MEFWSGAAGGFFFGTVFGTSLLNMIWCWFEDRAIDRQSRILTIEHGATAYEVALTKSDKARWLCNEREAAFWMRVARQVDTRSWDERTRGC